MMREVILTSEFFFQKRHLREVNCAQDQLHFFHLLPFFSLTPKTLMTTTSINIPRHQTICPSSDV
jgi:hypothetical protein